MKELEAVFIASRQADSAAMRSRKLPLDPVSASPTPPTTYRPEVLVVRRERFSRRILDQVSKNSYYAYTTKFDEIITPAELSEPADTMKLHLDLLQRLRREVNTYESKIAEYASHRELKFITL